MQTLTTEQFKEMRQSKDNLLAINVLDPEKFQQAHIPDTENIPVSADDFVQRVEQAAGSKDRPIVVYCASAECDASPKAAKMLEDAGFTNVYDYEGGSKAWDEAGEKLEMSTTTA